MNIPKNANENCPGSGSEEAGKSLSCEGCPNKIFCSTNVKSIDPDLALIHDRMKKIKHKILILSGKGGVGKSTVTTNLALALAESNNNCRQIGVLDIDICGPSQARMFDCEKESVHDSVEGWSPIYIKDNLSLMSIAFLMDSRNEAVIWRGPRKNALIKQFLKNVDWGEKLDYLLIDTPPGTSDEHISIVQLLIETGLLDGAIIVTTPQEISLLDVRKEINFCQKTKVPIIGIVENMSSFVCPCCSKTTFLFPSTTGGATKLCNDLNLKLLAQLPHDPKLAECVDRGQSYMEAYGKSGVMTDAFINLSTKIIQNCEC